MKPLAIIGLDPGTTAAYTALGLEGKILQINSGKQWPLSAMIQEITAICLPVIVSTDKAKQPFLITEFSRKCGARVITPAEDLKREEKRLLTLPFKPVVANEHQQDSLAAALYAHKIMSPRLNKIRGFLEENDLEEDKDRFTMIALKEDLSFPFIKERISKTRKFSVNYEPIIPLKEKQMITKKDFERVSEKLVQVQEQKECLQRELEALRERTGHLLKENQSMQHKSSHVEQRVQSLIQFKESRMRLQSQRLQQVLALVGTQKKREDELNQFIAQIEGSRLLKKVVSLGSKELEQKRKLLCFKERDILLVYHPQEFSQEVVEWLKQMGITLCSLKPIPAVIRKEVPTFQLRPADIILQREHYALVSPKVLEERYNTSDSIVHMIRDYQEERKRE